MPYVPALFKKSGWWQNTCLKPPLNWWPAHPYLSNYKRALAKPSWLLKTWHCAPPCSIAKFGLVSWWQLKDEQWQKIKVNPVLVANNSDSLIDAAQAGEGLAFFPDWWVEKQLSSGDLVEVPMQFPVSCDTKMHLDIYILYPQAKYQIPKIKHCVDFIMEHLARGNI